MLIYFAYPYVQKYRERMKMLDEFPGPKGWPLIGIALDLLNVKPVDVLNIFENIHKEYGSINRYQIGTKANILFTDPKDVEMILGSQKILEKSDEYAFLVDWLGTGLLISSNKKWFARRKVITPAFHFKILEQFVEIFDKHAMTFAQSLGRLSDIANGPVDVFQPITLCTLDIICGMSRVYIFICHN
jgi:cytochrome P450 family 4